ncbi:unnamed protein product [Closterium sp. Naga37s-1]|nr:unnamed protein product [Closterium sp. Naga37s-1]
MPLPPSLQRQYLLTVEYFGSSFTSGWQKQPLRNNPDLSKLSPPPFPLQRRYLLTVEYIGSAFSGWQKQPLGNNPLPSVQGALEEAIGKLVGSVPAGRQKRQRGKSNRRPQSEAQGRAGKEDAKADAKADIDANRLGASRASDCCDVAEAAAASRGDTVEAPPPPLPLPQVVGSSRTDAGVHALGNTCHVDIHRVSRRYPGKQVPPWVPKELTRAINHFLQLSAAEASVVAAKEVPLSFHARFQASERTYLYRIHASPSFHPSIFDRNRVWHVPAHLDVHAMRAAAAALCGFHDFSSFRASGCQARSPLRSLTELSIFEVPSWSACLPPPSHPSCNTWEGPERERSESRERREMTVGDAAQETADAAACDSVACGEKRGREGEGMGGGGRIEGASGKRRRGEERGEEGRGEVEDREGRDEREGGEGRAEREGKSEKEERKGEEGKEGEGGDEGEEGKEGKGREEREEGEGGVEGEDKGEGVQMLVVRARAPSFLYHQVRLLVGLLKAVGAGAVHPDTGAAAGGAAQGRGSRGSACRHRDIRGVPAMAPACGLYLASVAYGPKSPKQASLQE